MEEDIRWPGALPSYAILTTTPNSDVREIHDRMPLVLTAERFQPWLDPAAGSDVLAEILRATAEGFLHPREVSRMVNSPKNDGPECLEGPDDERHDD
ncbi:MAG: SOS response-associated peptidase family protein [Spirochaetia bacterium]|nr:SOS response-associated peptidase family protein [Spirochaetia bacterium]